MLITDRKLRVFLSYAHEDNVVVNQLFLRLKEVNWIIPWLDEEALLGGQNWTQVIEENIENSDALIIFLSNQSINKNGFVQREVRYAYATSLQKPEDAIFLIPVRIDNCNPPHRLKDLHYIDFFGEEEELDKSYGKLIRALQKRKDQISELESIEREHQKIVEQKRLAEEERARVVAEIEKVRELDFALKETKEKLGILGLAREQAEAKQKEAESKQKDLELKVKDLEIKSQKELEERDRQFKEELARKNTLENPLKYNDISWRFGNEYIKNESINQALVDTKFLTIGLVVGTVCALPLLFLRLDNPYFLWALAIPLVSGIISSILTILIMKKIKFRGVPTSGEGMGSFNGLLSGIPVFIASVVYFWVVMKIDFTNASSILLESIGVVIYLIFSVIYVFPVSAIGGAIGEFLIAFIFGQK